jgi:hypothetical protein
MKARRRARGIACGLIGDRIMSLEFITSTSRGLIVPMILASSAALSAVPAPRPNDPLRFFEGRTEGVSVVKVVMKKPYRSRTIGSGSIAADGTLQLTQRVEEEGKPPHNRLWRVRRVGPGRYSGAMSEAKGPVVIEEIQGRFRFRFKMAGGLSVDQWLTPLNGGTAASSRTTVRKFGMVVATSDGTIRKQSAN